MTQRVAIVVIHGIGEQVPMDTLSSFIASTWTGDLTLVPAAKPHPDTGAARTANASWYKPDPRTRNFDLHLITTETYETASGARRRADFFEFYWAHRVTGTPFESVRAWIVGLMLRNPFTKVPRALRLTWAAMWLLVIVGAAVIFWANRSLGTEAMAVAAAVYTAIAGWVVTKLNTYVGDIVRYVDPSPRNIVTRQAIREDGVRLLETLMGVGEDGTCAGSDYDRILVVGHSLGTIVGYDIVNHAFGRLNLKFDRARLAQVEQVHLKALEDLVRGAWTNGTPLDLARYRELQDAARRELTAAGHPWIVSDFISIGSPLTHAEFLMARDREHLTELKAKRVYPTCPPQLEFHRKKPHFHFTFQATKGLGHGGVSLAGKRVPHHAAAFAFTRWTNIYSPLRGIIGGDIVSGPVCEAFGLAARAEGAGNTICGIRDITVLPSAEGTDKDRQKRFLTHLAYWNATVAANGLQGPVPMHIQVLREALNLKEIPVKPRSKGDER